MNQQNRTVELPDFTLGASVIGSAAGGTLIANGATSGGTLTSGGAAKGEFDLRGLENRKIPQLAGQISLAQGLISKSISPKPTQAGKNRYRKTEELETLEPSLTSDQSRLGLRNSQKNGLSGKYGTNSAASQSRHMRSRNFLDSIEDSPYNGGTLQEYQSPYKLIG